MERTVTEAKGALGRDVSKLGPGAKWYASGGLSRGEEKLMGPHVCIMVEDLIKKAQDAVSAHYGAVDYEADIILEEIGGALLIRIPILIDGDAS